MMLSVMTRKRSYLKRSKRCTKINDVYKSLFLLIIFCFEVGREVCGFSLLWKLCTL